MSDRIRVVVTGACGRMGQEVVRTVLGQADMKLVGAADVGAFTGLDISEVAGGPPCGVLVKGGQVIGAGAAGSAKAETYQSLSGAHVHARTIVARHCAVIAAKAAFKVL